MSLVAARFAARRRPCDLRKPADHGEPNTSEILLENLREYLYNEGNRLYPITLIGYIR
jgi:hypothetical protein